MWATVSFNERLPISSYCLLVTERKREKDALHSLSPVSVLKPKTEFSVLKSEAKDKQGLTGLLFAEEQLDSVTKGIQKHNYCSLAVQVKKLWLNLMHRHTLAYTNFSPLLTANLC